MNSWIYEIGDRRVTATSRRQAELAARRDLRNSTANFALVLYSISETVFYLATLYRWHTTRTGRKLIVRELPETPINAKKEE